MKLQVNQARILDVIDKRADQYPRLVLVLDDGEFKGKQYELHVEFFGRALDDLIGLPARGDSFAGECRVSSRRGKNGYSATSISAQAGKYSLIPGRKQPGQRDPAPPTDDEIPF